MRLAWLSDPHLNFVSSEQLGTFFDTVRATKAEGLLLCGDSGEAPNIVNLLGKMSEALAFPIYFVLGNHDYYRGSIAGVRRAMGDLCAEHPSLHYLSAQGVVALSARTALIGHDGWGDARLGNVESSPVLLNDFFLIEELAGLRSPELRQNLQRLGDEAAAHLHRVGLEALQRFQNLVVLTHVPPFREACWHEGSISDDDWLPYFTCVAAGRVLIELAEQHPTRQLTVLCGHTHSRGSATMRPNLIVQTAQAEYGKPQLQALLDIA